MTVSIFQAPPKDQADEHMHRRAIAQAVQHLMSGRTNNVLEVTLDANQTFTDVVDARIGVNTVALCIPMTTNAAAITQPYRDYTNAVNGEMKLLHVSDASADKAFKVILVG